MHLTSRTYSFTWLVFIECLSLLHHHKVEKILSQEPSVLLTHTHPLKIVTLGTERSGTPGLGLPLRYSCDWAPGCVHLQESATLTNEIPFKAQGDPSRPSPCPLHSGFNEP